MSMSQATQTGAPQLSDEARRVLRVILDLKLVRGGELMRYAGFSMPEGLIEPVRELLNAHLVEVSGLNRGLNAESVMFATFGAKPSQERYLRGLASW